MNVSKLNDGVNLISLKPVKFKVGGKKFETTYTTATRYDTILKRIIEHGEMGELNCTSLQLTKDYFLIDRDGEKFHYILNFLRDGSVILPNSANAVREILVEAEFYSFQELINVCNDRLEDLDKQDFESVARCVYTKEEMKRIIDSKEPLIIMSHSDKLELVGDHARNFCNGVLYFHRMRNVFPRFRFVIDMVPKSGLSFSFDFVHNAKLITTVRVVESNGCGYTSYDFVTKFSQATSLLFASVASALDPSGVSYIADQKALMGQ